MKLTIPYNPDLEYKFLGLARRNMCFYYIFLILMYFVFFFLFSHILYEFHKEIVFII